MDIPDLALFPLELAASSHQIIEEVENLSLQEIPMNASSVLEFELKDIREVIVL